MTKGDVPWDTKKKGDAHTKKNGEAHTKKMGTHEKKGTSPFFSVSHDIGTSPKGIKKKYIQTEGILKKHQQMCGAHSVNLWMHPVPWKHTNRCHQ